MKKCSNIDIFPLHKNTCVGPTGPAGPRGKKGPAGNAIKSYLFNNQPLVDSYTTEVSIFEYLATRDGVLNIQCNVTPISDPNPADTSLDTIRLYDPDNNIVAASGYEAEEVVFAPNASCMSVNWVGSVKKGDIIKITAATTSQTASILKSVGVDAVGAHLVVLSL